MTTVALTATPTQLDSGSSAQLYVKNSSATAVVHILTSHGDTQLRPGEDDTFQTRGSAISAQTEAGNGQVDVTVISADYTAPSAPSVPVPTVNDAGKLVVVSGAGDYTLAAVQIDPDAGDLFQAVINVNSATIETRNLPFGYTGKIEIHQHARPLVAGDTIDIYADRWTADYDSIVSPDLTNYAVYLNKVADATGVPQAPETTEWTGSRTDGTLTGSFFGGVANSWVASHPDLNAVRFVVPATGWYDLRMTSTVV